MRFVLEKDQHGSAGKRRAAIGDITNLIALAANEAGDCSEYVEQVRRIQELTARELIDAGFNPQTICH